MVSQQHGPPDSVMSSLYYVCGKNVHHVEQPLLIIFDWCLPQCCIYHILFTHLSVDEYLGCFHISALVTKKGFPGSSSGKESAC